MVVLIALMAVAGPVMVSRMQVDRRPVAWKLAQLVNLTARDLVREFWALEQRFCL